MARTARLLVLLDRLRAAGSTTVEALAEELGVSPRTLFRDLATLRELGHPIAGEGGPGGGVSLARDAGLTSVHLGFAEIVTLWLSARIVSGASRLPFSHAANAGLGKLLGSLPEQRRRELRALVRRVVVGPPASAAMLAQAGEPHPEILPRFETAFTEGTGLGFRYVDREGRVSERRVEPHGLLVQPPLWYVLGFDLDKHEPRMFRMDRIGRPRVLGDVSFRPRREVLLALLDPEVSWTWLV